MGRIARAMSSSGDYHVMIRGNNREKIFKKRRDMRKFLDIIQSVKDRYGFKIYAYALMPNHVHLLLHEPEMGLIGMFMHDLETSYAAWFNIVHGRTGHVFQGRYKSLPVEDNEYFVNIVRYIHQNPVKAGLCIKPGDYAYSSYRSFFKKDAGIIDRDDVFKLIAPEEFEAFNEKEIARNDLKFLRIGDNPEPRVADEDAAGEMRSISACVDGAQLLGWSMYEIFKILRKFRKRGLSYRQIADFFARGKSTVFRWVKAADEALA